MVQIRQELVPSYLADDVVYGFDNPCDYIIIHETANTTAGADADAHANLQAKGNSRQASWQYQVDDKEIVQSFKDEAECWHAGSKFYNQNGIGIEICVNSDGDFKKAVANAAYLVRILMKRHGIPKSRVLQHRTTSGWKDCPRFLRSGSKGVDWDGFLAMLDGSAEAPVEAPKPVAPKPKPVAGKPDFDTNSVVDFLVSVGEDSSFSNRSKLAVKHGISGYDGSAAQNTKLLDKLKAAYKAASKPAPAPAPSGKGDMDTNSIVTYLNSIGVDSSYGNRAKLAAQYGIKGYEGSAAQNLALLEKMRNGAKPVAAKPAPKGDMNTGSIVTYLNSIGVDASFSNREKLAAKYGIRGYQGTAAQNTALLEKMRGGAAPVAAKPAPRGDQKTTSLVDYLKSIGEGSSFANREKLARQYGISGYKGTASQNTALLKKMRGH
ncbi:N-acetylmuramoyl-L-alanine amidase [Bacillus phage P59]|nr:N-acetylmuramoyl-L-alanine amidase [Bacillus phage P59]